VRDNKELQELIARLGSQLTDPSPNYEPRERVKESTGELPSADTIIKDLEDFLRGSQKEGG